MSEPSDVSRGWAVWAEMDVSFGMACEEATDFVEAVLRVEDIRVVRAETVD